jgi:polyhydroxyalkanoate synthesis regulator phasin
MDISKLPVKDIYNLVKNGEIDPIKAIVVLKQLEKKAKEYKSMIDEIVLDELSKYGKEGATVDGYNVNTRSSAGRWDFKHLTEIQDLEKQLKELKEKHKGAYKQMLHNLTTLGEGGEVIVPANFKQGKDIIIITKNK